MSCQLAARPRLSRLAPSSLLFGARTIVAGDLAGDLAGALERARVRCGPWPSTMRSPPVGNPHATETVGGRLARPLTWAFFAHRHPRITALYDGGREKDDENSAAVRSVLRGQLEWRG